MTSKSCSALTSKIPLILPCKWNKLLGPWLCFNYSWLKCSSSFRLYKSALELVKSECRELEHRYYNYPQSSIKTVVFFYCFFFIKSFEMPHIWWFMAWIVYLFCCLCLCIPYDEPGVVMATAVTESVRNFNLQEAIATGWSICNMKMAPEGPIVAVQLAICCGSTDRAGKAPLLPVPYFARNKEWHF